VNLAGKRLENGPLIKPDKSEMIGQMTSIAKCSRRDPHPPVATSTLGYERDPASPTMPRTGEELEAKRQILGIRL
jgi:hypothetical protein